MKNKILFCEEILFSVLTYDDKEFQRVYIFLRNYTPQFLIGVWGGRGINEFEVKIAEKKVG